VTVAALDALSRLESRIGLRLPDVAALVDRIDVIELKERESAFHANEICPRIFFVRAGLLKQLYVKEDGTEWIKSFTGPGDAFACVTALSPGGRTTFASVAIEASVVESIDFRLVERVADTSLAWQKAVRFAFQYLAEVKIRRERDLLMFTPEELYRRFASASPELAKRVPQKDLAAFLGVTPVGLNRIIRRQASVPGRTR
jgi:CRP-like cAMP-binding protein